MLQYNIYVVFGIPVDADDFKYKYYDFCARIKAKKKCKQI